MTEKQVEKRKETDLADLSLSSLAHLCQQTTDRYFKNEDIDDGYCLELFRRAIEQEDQNAWAVIVDRYQNLVLAWVGRHHSFVVADEDQDYFVNRAFDSFWSAFSRNPHKLSKFSNLKSLLQYLKLCTYSAVQEYVERRMPPRHIQHSEFPVEALAERVDSISYVDDNMIAGIVWKYVVSTVKTKQESAIAEDYLLHDMKPQEIYARHTDLFSSAGQVRRVKGNFMTRLRRNRQLAAIMAEID